MTSIVIPYATGSTASRWNHTELRYMLRGAERYLKGYGEIFLVGVAPPWLRNVTVIPATDHDKTYHKERNIFNKVMLACQDERVTDDFLFMNDDHFLLKEFEPGIFPCYYDGYLSGQLARTSPYRQTIVNTYKHLSEDFRYYDVHCPILYSKKKFRYLSYADWDLKYGYCIKTMYCINHGIIEGPFGEQYPDLKLKGAMSYTQIKRAIAGRPFFSTSDNCRDGAMEAVLQELYPNKSKYEA